MKQFFFVLFIFCAIITLILYWIWSILGLMTCAVRVLAEWFDLRSENPPRKTPLKVLWTRFYLRFFPEGFFE